jgi:hypothetical protein
VPEGCETCTSTIEWDCLNCLWKENYWKYDEVTRFLALVRAVKGSELIVDKLISSGDLDYIDLIKLGILKERLHGYI